jgi:hypothetical protein
MVHLQHSRFEPATRSSNTTEEDDLALRMLRLAAHWWPIPIATHTIRTKSTTESHTTSIFSYNESWISSTSDGVWVFKYLADSDCINLRPSHAKEPDNWRVRMGYISSMDEQWDALKQFGAKFFTKVEDCEDISTTLEQAVRKGNHYDELLKKMKDFEYLEGWLNES